MFQAKHLGIFVVPGHRALGPNLNKDILIKPRWEERVLRRRNSLLFLLLKLMLSSNSAIDSDIILKTDPDINIFSIFKKNLSLKHKRI